MRNKLLVPILIVLCGASGCSLTFYGLKEGVSPPGPQRVTKVVAAPALRK